jgi:hypothetical protein
MTAGGVVTNSAILSPGQSLAQSVPGNAQYGVKALLLDMFGTVLDWRTGVARSVEATLKPRGYQLDWFAFADTWREQYDPGMEEVRSGRIPYEWLHTVASLRLTPGYRADRDLPGRGPCTPLEARGSARDVDRASLDRHVLPQ